MLAEDQMSKRLLSRPIGRLRCGLLRSEDGLAATEWGLILPVLIVIALGLVDYGAMAKHKMEMANAVRAGTQYATIRKPIQGNVTPIVNAVANAAPADTSGSRVINAALFCRCSDGTEISCGDTCPSGERSSFVRIRMREDYRMILSYPLFETPLTLQTEATVRLN